MAVVVSLRDLVDELLTLTNESSAYLQKSSGKLITISADDLEIARNMDESGETEAGQAGENINAPGEPPDWQIDVFQEIKDVLLHEDDYLKLPGKFEINEYEIMERFCLSVSDESIGDVLLDKIRGSGAFRRFKDAIYQYGIEKDWFKFKDEALKEITVSWLESNGLDYADDMNRHEKSL
jgi:hypothetical protein